MSKEGRIRKSKLIKARKTYWVGLSESGGRRSMARKRERRSGQRESDDSAEAPKISSSRPNKTTTTTTTSLPLLVFLIVAISVLVYRSTRYNNNVNTDITYRQVLADNMNKASSSQNSSSSRNFMNPVLAYITPWNSKGFDMANKFSNKFTHLSPVWYELKSQGAKLVLEGRHNADKQWISDIRRTSPNAKIIPRVVLEANPLDLLKKKKQKDKVVTLIISECREMEYDGIVLESWSRWAAYGVLHDPVMKNLALKFIRQLGEAMHSISMEQSPSQSLQLVYVIGPPRSDKLEEYDFGPEDFRSLSDAVDGFSLMTYDFSGPQNPGPNAPLKWIHSTLQLLLNAITDDDRKKLAKRIFIGINFYGNDFIVSGGLGGGPIVGREYLSLLEKYQPELRWEKNSAEHFFLYLDNQDVKHVVFYPSLTSIAIRLQEASSWGAGISIWEIGQGLEYFFDIL